MAIDLRFFSSASFRTFFTAFSKSCCELPDPPLQVGLLTWITNLAGKLCPGQIAATISQCVCYFMQNQNFYLIWPGIPADPEIYYIFHIEVIYACFLVIVTSENLMLLQLQFTKL